MPGLEFQELHDLVGEEDFRNHVLQAAELTSDDGRERGFAAYRKPSGEITLSDVLDPDDAYQDAMRVYEARLSDLPSGGEQLASLLRLPDAEFQRVMARYREQVGSLPLAERLMSFMELFRGTDEIIAERPELSLALILEDDAGSPRTDVQGAWHTHPTLHVGAREPRRFLLPSATDLVTYADNLAHNAGMIEGTIATHHKLGGTAMMLYRAPDDNGEVMQRLQTLEPGVTNVDETLMASLGLRTTTIVYNRRSGELRSGLSSLHRLFE